MSKAFTITTREATWLSKAVSTDTHRPVLAYAAIACLDGDAVIAATDTHRLHILNLGPVKAEFATVILDIRRLVYEADYEHHREIRFAPDFSSVECVMGPKQPPQPCYAPVLNAYKAVYPNFGRVIPKSRKAINAVLAINSRFLAEATELSRVDEVPYRVVMLGESQNGPVIFQPIGDKPRWMAVVMPMNCEGWGLDIEVAPDEVTQ